MFDSLNIIEYEKKINSFTNKVREIHPIKLLKTLYLYRVIYSRFKDRDELISSLIIYLTNIYQSIEVNNTNSNSTLKLEQLESLINDFSIIYFESLCITMKNEDDASKVTRIKDFSHGISYPFITLEVFSYLLEEQNDLIKDSYNISVSNLMNELVKMSLILRSLPKTVDLKRDISELIKNIDEFLPDEFFNILEQTEIPDKLLYNLGNKVGKSTDFLNRNNYPGWLYVDLPTTFKPLLIYNGGIYIFHHNLFIDGIYRNIQRNITNEDRQIKELWNINQKKASEGFVLNLLKNFFKTCIYYENNYYIFNKNRHENDILIIENDLLLIVEVKAGSFSYRSSVADSQSHEKSINELIEKPISQVTKFLDVIHENGSVTIFDENGKVKSIIDKKDYNIILGLSVTIDHFNEISANYYNYKGSKKISAIPISIFDLYILLIYFKSKIQFIHYLQFRISDFVSKMMVADELVYLEMYIINEHFSNFLQEQKSNKNIGYVYTDPNVELMDKYFNTYPNLIKQNRPDKKLNLEFKKIIKVLEKSKNPNSYKAGTTLLNIPFKFQKRFINDAKNQSKWGYTNRKFAFTTTSDDDTQIILGYVQKKEKTDFLLVNMLGVLQLNTMIKKMYL